MHGIIFNPGGNSLKMEVVDCREDASAAFEAKKLASIRLEGIGKKPALTDAMSSISEEVAAADYAEAAERLVERYERSAGSEHPSLAQMDYVALRVVHGGDEFDRPQLLDSAVEEKIAGLERLAPLHNRSSIEVLKPIRRIFVHTPIYGVFDTAFHRTIPEYAASYAIPPDLAGRYRIRRYGFHGISHRYLLERYAAIAGKPVEACNVVSMHLESGCSMTAVRNGRSVDNTMGLTPLEGLMMGTRSGDVDPTVISLLMREAGMGLDEVMTVLNKQSGLAGVSEVSLDTRVLMRDYDRNARVKLAMDMFAYRVRKAAGAYFAALGMVDAVLFGGGIATNTKFVRRCVCDGLRGFGVEMDEERNEALIDVEGQLSTDGSRVKAWVIPSEEGLQMAHECCQALVRERAGVR